MVLAIGGCTMLICGLVLAALGLWAGTWIRSQLPPVVIDAAAVGGATFALGILVAGAGGVQVGVAWLVPRQGRWMGAAASTIAGLLAGLLLACAVAALTQFAGGGSGWLLVVAVVLAASALAYGASAWSFARASAQPVP